MSSLQRFSSVSNLLDSGNHHWKAIAARVGLGVQPSFLLFSQMSGASVSIGKPKYERQNGSLAGYAGVDGIEDAECAGDATWLRHCEADRADKRQYAGDQSRNSLSGAAEAGAGGFDRVGVGYLGEQS